MQLEKLYYRVLLVFIIIGHLFAGVQFWLKREEIETFEVWINQFYFLLMISLLLSLVLFFNRTPLIVGKVYFAIKVVVFILIGYAEGNYLGVEFTLLTLLIIEVSAYFRFIQSIFITFTITFVTVFNQREIIAWDIPLSRVPLHDLLSLAVYSSIVAIFANALYLAIKKLDEQALVVNRLDKAASQLMDVNMGFQQYAVTAGEESAVQERKRISRDIHDTAVHTFITMIMLAESTMDLLEPAQKKAIEILQQLISQAKEGVKDTRQALRELRAIDEVSPKGLRAIYQLIKVFQEVSGVQVEVDFGNAPWELEEDIDRILYRMIQEGLTNAFRHGNATHITIHLWIVERENSSELVLRIHDNGKGSLDIKKGIGLQGMEERIQKLHGYVEAKNVPDGFEVSARIPFHNRKGMKG